MTKIIINSLGKPYISSQGKALLFKEVVGSYIVITTNKKLATLTCGSQSYTLTGDDLSHAFPVVSGTYVCTATFGSVTNSSTVTVTANGIYNVEISVSILPVGYVEVEYIESTGTQFIDTEITNENCDSYGVQTEYCWVGINNTSMCGNYASSGASFGQIFITTGHVSSVWSGVGNAERCRVSDVSAGIWCSDEYTIDCVNGTIERTYDSTVLTGSGLDFSTRSSQHCYLFACDTSGGAAQFSSIKVKTFKILKDNVVVRDFVPCIRSADNLVGMYDLVSQTFFLNRGSGVFIAGPDVN